MSNYRLTNSFAIPLILLAPSYTTVKGVQKKVYPDTGPIIWGSFKTYGGTERNVNDVYAIEDTANVETWFRPDIKSDCRVILADTGALYEIVNEPENIDMRNQYCKFKVRRVKGGA